MSDFIESEKKQPLNFERLRSQNIARCVESFGKNLNDWTDAQWCCAISGEVGELCNLIKKEFRGFEKIPAIDIQHEIADIAIYLDLFAASRGIDLGEAIRLKFNLVSDKMKAKRYL